MLCLQNPYFSIELDEQTRAVAVSHADGRRVEAAPAVPFASVFVDGQILHSETADWSDGKLRLSFAGQKPLVLAVSGLEECLRLTVESCPDCDYLTFAKGVFPDENLLGMGLNSRTTGAEWVKDPGEVGVIVHSTKAPSGAQLILAQGILGAQAFRATGVIGASYAVVGAPDAKTLRDLAKRTVERLTEDIPYSRKGGAFAADAENQDLRNSYLMNFNGISEAEADDWIDMARSFGAKQIDFHGGSTFRFGDYFFDPQKYPDGGASMKRVIDRLHEAGIQAGLHTYAQFVSPYSRYVTPIPHPDLAGTDYTLAADMTLSSDRADVLESTDGVTSATGFFVPNSAHLVIDQEILRFDTAGGRGFRIVGRGEFGTTPAPHKKGAKVRHLLQLFGLFVPDGDSELYLEVARRTAETYNACGFDMMYLDAIDGTSCLKKTDAGFPEHDLSWYYANRFVSEIMRCANREPILEMSAMWHHMWFYRSRMGAWDHSRRAHKTLLAEHNRSNLRSLRRSFLPQNYGWWCYGKTDPSDPVQVQRMYLDDYEYFASRACRNDWSLALCLHLEDYQRSGELQRAARLIQKYEQLRLSGRHAAIPDSPECLMRESGEIVPVAYHAGVASSDRSLTVRTEADGSLLLLRVENLPRAVPEGKICLLDSSDASRLQTYNSTTVESSVESGADEEPARPYLHFRASQNGSLGCARFEKRFASPLDAKTPRAVGFWLYGDGKGEKVDVQLISPKTMNSGTCDFAVRVDFTGWRYFLLENPTPALLSEDAWPFSGGGHYNDPPYIPEFDIAKDVPVSQTEWHPSRRDAGVYMLTRENIRWDCVESISVLLGGMRDGETYDVRLGSVEAFALESCELNDPVIFCNDVPVQIRGTLAPFSFAEWRDGVFAAFDAQGVPLPDVTMTPPPAVLPRGENRFSADAQSGQLAVTVGLEA